MARPTTRSFCYAIASLVASACASAGGAPPPNPAPTAYRIGPEDVIEVVVWNSDAVNRTVPVRPDGMISLPLVSDVRAAGLTALELRDVLANAFEKFIPSPEVFVIVREINSPKVWVMGEVVHPGRHVIRGPTTALDIIALAGGLTEFASGSNATLVRTVMGKTERFTFDARTDEDMDVHSAIQIQPGDVIVVP